MTGRVPDAVVFDLDGTLLDTSGDLATALNHCLMLQGLPALPTSRIKHLVGHGARALLAAGLTEYHGVANAAIIEQMVPEFMAFYSANIATETRPYAHVVDVLNALRQRGVAMGVCTNKPASLSHKVLAATGLSPYFASMIGGDTLPVRKPDPAPLRAALAALGDPAVAIMVGDSEVDIATAKAAGVPVIAVSFGFSGVPLAHFGPDAIIDSFADFLPALDALLTPRL